MVLGILTAVAACPAIIGTTEAVKQGQRQNAREEHRTRRCNLTVTLVRHSPTYSPRFNGARIVIHNGKLWIDTRPVITAAEEPLHPYTGYFLAYPDDKASFWREQGFAKGEGMVTTISDEQPPFLHWVYVDRNTGEVKHGIRRDAEPHVVGPWDVTKIDRRLTCEGWEGFVAVQEEDGSHLWALYFDRADNGLRGEGKIGNEDKRMLYVDIWRKEPKRDLQSAIDERIERLQERQEKEAEKEGHKEKEQENGTEKSNGDCSSRAAGE